MKNKVSIITGGTGALGSVIAGAFLDAGMVVAIPYLSPSAPAKLPENMCSHDRVMLQKRDITSEQEVTEFVLDVVQRYGTIDVLVCAAGGYSGGQSVEATPIEDWEQLMSLNLKSTFLMARAVVGRMKEKGWGRIVTVAAMTALSPSAKKSAYTVSKRGVIALTEVLAEETKGTGVTVNTIAPGTILTEANRHWMTKGDDQKWVTPQEIASLVMYLCSDAARSISGTTIRIGGAA